MSKSESRDWSSHRYQTYQAAGFSPDEDEIRAPIPHWESNLRTVEQNADPEDWLVYNRQNGDEWVKVENADYVIDLQEVR